MKLVQRHVAAPMAVAAFAALDKVGATRSGPFAQAVGLGIQAEAAARALLRTATRSQPAEVHVHVGGSGPPIVLVNGWTASGLVWPRQLIERLERRHTVLRVDNRGTGWSRGCAHPFSIKDLAGDLREVLHRHAISEATVVGVSMGGMVAQELAIREPDLVSRLVLIATAPPSPEYVMPQATVTGDLFVVAAKVDLASRIRATWLPTAGSAFAAAAPEVFDDLVRAVVERPTPHFAVLAQARAMAAWHGAHRLRRISAPTTVIHGAEDPLIPVRNGMRLSQLIPGARYIDVPGAGHLLPFEAADLIADVLEEKAA